MSSHYEVVVSCFLEARTPDTVLSTLFWLLGHSEERPHHLDDDTFPYQMFDPDPDSRLPGGDLAVLRQQKRGLHTYGEVTEWGLHVRVLVPDEGLSEIYEFLELIEPHVAGDGYAGHIRAEDDTTQLELLFLDGTAPRLGHPDHGTAPGAVLPDDSLSRFGSPDGNEAPWFGVPDDNGPSRFGAPDDGGSSPFGQR